MCVKDGAVLVAQYELSKRGGSVLYADGNRRHGQFGLRVFNSMNYESGVGFELNALRLVCKKWADRSQEYLRLSFRHFQGLDVSRFTRVGVLDEFAGTLRFGGGRRDFGRAIAAEIRPSVSSLIPVHKRQETRNDQRGEWLKILQRTQRAELVNKQWGTSGLFSFRGMLTNKFT